MAYTNTLRAPGRVATPPQARHPAPSALPSELSSVLQAVAACPGVTSMRHVEDLLLSSERQAAQSVASAAAALLGLERATHQIRQSDDSKRKLKKARLQLRDMLLWRSVGSKADILDKTAVFSMFPESLSEEMLSQIGNSYAKIQEKLLRELVCSSFMDKLAKDLKNSPDKAENEEVQSHLQQVLGDILFANSADTTASASGSGDQDWEPGSHEESVPRSHAAQDESEQQHQPQSYQQQAQHQQESGHAQPRNMYVKNTFLHVDDDACSLDVSKFSKGWKSWHPQMQTGTDCSATEAGTHAEFSAGDWFQQKEADANWAVPRQQSVPGLPGDSSIMVEALVSKLKDETQPSKCAQLARMIAELMPQVASENAGTSCKEASNELATTVRKVAKHVEHLRAVLKALANCSGLGFVREAKTFKDCVALDLLAETWHGCVQSTNIDSLTTPVPDVCIESTFELLDKCVMRSSSDTQSVRHSCEALGALARARLRDGKASHEAQNKLCDVMDHFWQKDSKVLECCLWELIKLSKHCILGLHISKEQLLCKQATGHQMQDDKLLQYMGKCTNPVKKLGHKLHSRTHMMQDILERIVACTTDEVADVLSAVLDEVEHAVKQPVRVFMHSNDEEFSADVARHTTKAERDWAREVLRTMLHQRVDPPRQVMQLCLQWARTAALWHHIEMRQRFVLLGTLFGESILVLQLKNTAVLQESNGEDVLWAVIRALQDLKVLHPFDPSLLQEGLDALLSVNASSGARLGSAIAGGLATLLPDNPSAEAVEAALERLMSLSSGKAGELGLTAFMHEVSWALHSILSKSSKLSADQARSVKSLSEEIQNKYNDEANAAKYAADIARIVSASLQ
eukprot:TRINITY_DN49203_c0_g1_i1.p1 TRINITY_DN49203_c0_g1~~TRINITY_DN49203_c0_g1_i1.p1  ORF type:complete len:857 (-),score=187.81 TRINITY_DN49203_c0_g1_i1:52-2622(-)